MKPKPARTSSTETADEEALRAIHYKMIAAWNAGDATTFIAPFVDDADFVAFEGTHLKGRDEMIRFHQPLFDTVLKGSRMVGEVKFVRFIGLTEALMHSVVSYALAEQAEAPASRDSMQLTIFSKKDGEWRAEALMNARRVTIEKQIFLDDLELLAADAQQRVNDLVAFLKTPHSGQA